MNASVHNSFNFENDQDKGSLSHLWDSWNELKDKLEATAQKIEEFESFMASLEKEFQEVSHELSDKLRSFDVRKELFNSSEAPKRTDPRSKPKKRNLSTPMKLRHLIMNANLSKNEIARRLDCCPSSVANWLRGRTISANNAARLDGLYNEIIGQ